jgi:DHA2 family multidrug resistance protein
MGLFGSLFLLPLFLQRLLGYSAMESGIALMPRSLAMAVLMPIAGRFYNRLGPRVLVAAGLLVSAYSFWDLSHLSTRSRSAAHPGAMFWFSRNTLSGSHRRFVSTRRSWFGP